MAANFNDGMDETSIDESNFYKLLNISRNASEAEIIKAFRTQALKFHPDKHTGREDLMKLLNRAKETLLDPEKRQNYDNTCEDEATVVQDISGYLNSGKKLSRSYQRKLTKYTAAYKSVNLHDNFATVLETVNNFNDELLKLVNNVTSVSPENLPKSDPDQTKRNKESLQSFFYEGRYTAMARFMTSNQCSADCISTLHDSLSAGRAKLDHTPISFQAGLLLLQSQICANERKHESCLKALQEAVFKCPSDEVVSAVNILMETSTLIAPVNVVIKQILSNNVEPVQVQQYQDGLKKTSYVRLVIKFDKATLQDKKASNWDKAMMYIDFTLASSGIAVIHCFFVAMTYLLDELTHIDGDGEEEMSRTYALCNIICDLAVNVVVLARKYALPVTEMHFNKFTFHFLLQAHQTLRLKLNRMNNKKKSKLVTKLSSSNKKPSADMITETQAELYKMIANSIYRLIKVSPFVDLPLTLIGDMIYLDLISDQFVENFYESKLAINSKCQDKESWSHLYRYYLLECSWKRGDDLTFGKNKEESMKSLLQKNAWIPEDVEEIMSWNVINRNEGGWLEVTQPWLNLQETNYNSIDGVEIDISRGTFRILRTPSKPGTSGLFNDLDVMEVFLNGITHSIFTLDPPNNDLQYHPFQQLKFTPRELLHTNFLQTLLHADYLLKMMTVGVEVSANAPHLFRNASKDGFLTALPPHLREKLRPISERHKGNRRENVHRFWIESDTLEYSKETRNDGNTLRYSFGSCGMQVKTHLMKNNADGELIDDSEDNESDSEESEDENSSTKAKEPKKPKEKRISPETEFANDLTECYDEVGTYFPILLRLRELTKLAAAYALLHNMYDSLETAKKELEANLTARIRKAIDEKRKTISFPQSNSSNVNKHYRQLLKEQRINESNLAPGEEDRAKRSIKQQLEEVDNQIVASISKQISSAFQISNCYEFSKKIRNWLKESYTKQLVAYIVTQVYPREYEKLDRFAKNAAANGICFDRDDEKENKANSDLTTPSDYDECPWVPAAFCRDSYHRVYGGVCLFPQLKEVPRSVLKNANISNLKYNSGGGGGGEGRVQRGNSRGDLEAQGNNKNSNRAQHIYMIIKHNPGGNLYENAKRDARNHPTLTYKVGISHDVVLKQSHDSQRARRQVAKLNKIYVDKQITKCIKEGGNQQAVDKIKAYYEENPVYTSKIVSRLELSEDGESIRVTNYSYDNNSKSATEKLIPAHEAVRSTALAGERNLISEVLNSQWEVFGANNLPGNKEPNTTKQRAR